MKTTNYDIKNVTTAEEVDLNRYYICKRLRRMTYLNEKGFNPVHIITEPNGIFKNFIYEITPELIAAIGEYQEMIKNRH